jgi:uncharacterized phiE125 gp8 family phage protein
MITQPAAEPLTLEEAKRYLKIDESDEDLIITSLIKQAREYCEGQQNRKYITQTLELILDKFPPGDSIKFFDCSPVQSITSAKYTDYTCVEKTIDPVNYILDNDSFVNQIALAYGKAWPVDTLQPVNGIRIRFVAGFGDASAVPETIKWAMVLHMRLLHDDMRPDEKERLEIARDALLSTDRVVPV